MTDLEEVAMEKSFDLLIVGSGLSGALLAAEVARSHPDWKIGLIDKERTPGGRLATYDREDQRWYFGLSALSEKVYEQVRQSLEAYGLEARLQDVLQRPIDAVGVLAASKLSTVPLSESCSDKGGRVIAGAAAARDWTLVDELLALRDDEKKAEQSIAQVWKGTRKSPSGIALEHMSRLWGVADLWTSTTESLFSRWQEFSEAKIRADWSSITQELLAAASQSGNLTTFFDTSAIAVDKQEQRWHLRSTKGELQSERLAVCQSPWEALLWLPKEYLPSKLVSLATKTKPISGVVLSEHIETMGELDNQDVPVDLMIVTAENCQVYLDRDHQAICFQATIPYEWTLDAPEVVKAVRRLKRAKKKLHAAFDGFASRGEHIALLPVAWSHPLQSNERRALQRLDMSAVQKKDLVFCSDAYGSSYRGDDNLIHSLQTSLSVLSPS